jgi:hypothetical protein
MDDISVRVILVAVSLCSCRLPLMKPAHGPRLSVKSNPPPHFARRLINARALANPSSILWMTLAHGFARFGFQHAPEALGVELEEMGFIHRQLEAHAAGQIGQTSDNCLLFFAAAAASSVPLSNWISPRGYGACSLPPFLGGYRIRNAVARLLAG